MKADTKKRIITGALILTALLAMFFVINTAMNAVVRTTVVIDGQTFGLTDRTVELYPLTTDGFEHFAEFERLEELKIVPMAYQLKENARNELAEPGLTREIQRIDEEFADCTDISDVNFLRNNTNLRILDLHGCAFSDMTVIAQMKGLEELNISDTAVTDISLLGGSAALVKLDIRGTGIDDIAPLLACPQLAQIRLDSVDDSTLKQFEEHGITIICDEK